MLRLLCHNYEEYCMDKPLVSFSRARMCFRVVIFVRRPRSTAVIACRAIDLSRGLANFRISPPASGTAYGLSVATNLLAVYLFFATFAHAI